MSQPPAIAAPARRILRCKACNGKVPVELEQALINCPMCGLAVVTGPGMNELHPMAVPRADQKSCWDALVKERALPVEPRATLARCCGLGRVTGRHRHDIVLRAR